MKVEVVDEKLLVDAIRRLRGMNPSIRINGIIADLERSVLIADEYEAVIRLRIEAKNHQQASRIAQRARALAMRVEGDGRVMSAEVAEVEEL
jgi:hypothetical protein